jgi:hypothetical protein
VLRGVCRLVRTLVMRARRSDSAAGVAELSGKDAEGCGVGPWSGVKVDVISANRAGVWFARGDMGVVSACGADMGSGC